MCAGAPSPCRGQDAARHCGRRSTHARRALRQAGYSPEVVKVYGLGQLPDFTRGRKEVKQLTGQSFVPVLVLEDGQVVKDSRNIQAWARENPTGANAASKKTI